MIFPRLNSFTTLSTLVTLTLLSITKAKTTSHSTSQSISFVLPAPGDLTFLPAPTATYTVSTVVESSTYVALFDGCCFLPSDIDGSCQTESFCSSEMSRTDLPTLSNVPFSIRHVAILTSSEKPTSISTKDPTLTTQQPSFTTQGQTSTPSTRATTISTNRPAPTSNETAPNTFTGLGDRSVHADLVLVAVFSIFGVLGGMGIMVL
ncbi:hypothetical protein NHQ30_004281 [Ciborinia camelliae]|nr:hypothetical protein NHQ30_004281 [Ciborinia camelliae]